nr:gamma-glutamylcyclotransferase [Nereida sp. MMG025]
MVNTRTHAYPYARPAEVSGWRRAWRHTGLRDVAFLTAVPCPDTTISGLVAAVPDGDWMALDEREAAYRRHAAKTSYGDAAIYAIDHDHQPPSQQHPILLSYLDVVVQGYFQVFGVQGVSDFFATTDGWDAPILNDRAAPRYPRHQMLSPTETRLVDENLSAVGAKWT